MKHKDEIVALATGWTAPNAGGPLGADGDVRAPTDKFKDIMSDWSEGSGEL